MKTHFRIFTLFLMLLALGCTRQEGFEGPDLVDIYGEFKLLQPFSVDKSFVDFKSGEKVVFSAEFSKQVNWKIKITGRSSGSEHLIEGFSSKVERSNAEWLGNTTTLPMFTREVCDVELSVPAEMVSYNDSITIDSTKTNAGFVVADFENGFDPNWTGFVQSGANMSFNITDSEPAGQGNFYYDMGGEVNWDYLIGLIDFPATAYGGPRFNLSNNPDRLYFNVMLYLPSGINNAIVLFQLREDDDEDGSFNENNEDMYSLEMKDLKVGWQLVSIKYSDLVSLENGMPAPAKGNKLHEPNKLHKISVLMLADPSTGYSQTYMDYLIFTENEALRP